jgi:subtilisin family serine protease
MVLGLIVAQPRGPDPVSGLAPRCRALTASWGTLESPVVKIRAEFLRRHPEATPQEVQREQTRHQDTLQQWGRRWAVYQVASAAGAIRYLVDHGCRVINISGLLLKSQCPSDEAWKKLEEAFAYAAGKNVVLGAGNNAAASEDYPGDSRSVIVVGASLLNDRRWEEERELGGTKIKVGSNFGKRLTCMAPVEDLAVCVPHDKRMYEWASGPSGPMKIPFNGAYDVRPNGATSAAAPVVSALAALVVSARPDLDARAVVRLIEQGCDDIGDPGHDLATGHGRVNYANTLRSALNEGKQ